MNYKRLHDQILVMGAIKIVKNELSKSDLENWIQSGEIVVRLATLYSLLDIDRLMTLAIKLDEREDKAA